MRCSEWQESDNSLRSGYQIQRVADTERWQYEEHCHRGFCEIVYVIDGTLRQTVNGRELIQQAGDLLLLRANDPHSLSGCGFAYANIMFQENWLLRLEQFTQLRGLADQLLTAAEPPRATIAAERQPAYRETIDQLIGSSRDETGRYVFSGFLVNVVTRHLATPLIRNLPDDMPDWLHSAVLWLNRQHNAPPTLSELIRRSCRSQEHFTRLFTRHMGISPSRYLARMRIDQAAILLSTTNCPVQEITGLCGFENESYFYRLFRRQKDITPLGYRRRHGPRSIQRRSA